MSVQIQQKTYDAVVGDVFILANRLQHVDFTHPYTHSGLTMIVPTKPEGSSLMFTKPFTRDMSHVVGNCCHLVVHNAHCLVSGAPIQSEF